MIENKEYLWFLFCGFPDNSSIHLAEFTGIRVIWMFITYYCEQLNIAVIPHILS